METKLLALLILNSLAYTYGIETCNDAALLKGGCSIDATLIPPDPLCSAKACAWGTVTHTYSCANIPKTRTCTRDCSSCKDVHSWDNCLTKKDNENLKKCIIKANSICSKKQGVGYQAVKLACEKPDLSITTFHCSVRCCCESFPQGRGAVVQGKLTCASKNVADYRKNAVKTDQIQFCPGYEIAAWNKK